MAKIVQTAGRNALGEFAPEFAHFNDDVLFGENWNNQDIDVKTRSIITVVALMASGITDSSLKFHLQNAKDHGVTQKEIAAIITHVAFYAGWPKGWAVFNLAKEVWSNGEGDLPYEDEAMRAHAKQMVFPIGEPNDAHAYGISTAVIAEKFGYNPDYMARFFKKYMNCTVTDYIYLVRIGYVHRALVNTNDSVADIFERHGCTNHHLSMKYFRNQYGCTPREHRKKEQSKYKT